MTIPFIKLPSEWVAENGRCTQHNVYGACPFSQEGPTDGTIPTGVPLCETPLPGHCKIHQGLDR